MKTKDACDKREETLRSRHHWALFLECIFKRIPALISARATQLECFRFGIVFILEEARLIRSDLKEARGSGNLTTNCWVFLTVWMTNSLHKQDIQKILSNHGFLYSNIDTA